MTLVNIPTNDTINGISPVLGVQQTIDSRALPNLLAFAAAFHAAGHGRLDVTEASRARPRQLLLWNEYEAYVERGKKPPVAALAAIPYTSIHDAVTHGNAVDLGSGIATLGSAAQKWAAANGPEYGVRPTGLGFVSKEPWHFDIDLTTTASSSATRIDAEPTPAAPQRRKKTVKLVINFQQENAFYVFDTDPALAGTGVARRYSKAIADMTQVGKLVEMFGPYVSFANQGAWDVYRTTYGLGN